MIPLKEIELVLQDNATMLGKKKKIVNKKLKKKIRLASDSFETVASAEIVKKYYRNNIALEVTVPEVIEAELQKK